MLHTNTIQSEKGLRDLIVRNLRKEIHPGTKPSIDFIQKILDDAYDSGMPYDLTDMRSTIVAFANGSSNQPLQALKIVQKMRFQGKDASGEILPGVYNVPISIGPGYRTNILNVALQIDPRHVGDLWFEIYVDENLSTKFPFRIIHEAPRTTPSDQESISQSDQPSDLAE